MPPPLPDPARPLYPVSIITPTLREAKNLAALVERIKAALPERPWELIIVDDDSDDGTEKIAAELSRTLPVRLHNRRGDTPDLSLAVLDGIDASRHNRIVVMDADGSHRPEDIPALLDRLGKSCDMVIGSRYIGPGGITENWTFGCRLNSRIATELALPLTPRCHDPLSGFFAVDQRALPDRNTLDPIGYKIALELIVKGGLRVEEVPIRFETRAEGKSKLGWRQRLDYLRHLGRLYRHVARNPC